jgi:hypothetical protein
MISFLPFGKPIDALAYFDLRRSQPACHLPIVESMILQHDHVVSDFGDFFGGGQRNVEGHVNVNLFTVEYCLIIDLDSEPWYSNLSPYCNLVTLIPSSSTNHSGKII